MKVRGIRKQAQKRMKRDKQFIWIWSSIEVMSGWVQGLYKVSDGISAINDALKSVDWATWGKIAKTVQVTGRESGPPVVDYIREMKRGHDEYLRNLTRSA